MTIMLIAILSSSTSHIIKKGDDKGKHGNSFLSKLYRIPMLIFESIMTSFMRMLMWFVDKDWWFKGPFRRIFPWFLGTGVIKILYAGEVYTTEETVAILENMLKKTEEKGKELHVSLTPCVCRAATNNWSDEMPNMTCMHFGRNAIGFDKVDKYTILISPETAIQLVKEYAFKWPFVHTLFGFCPSSPEYFNKEIALCFCHHHCATIRCEIKRGKNGLHPIKKADHLAVISNDLCDNCAICYDKCPFFAIIKLKDNKLEVNHDICFGCGVCTRFCPNDAIKLIDRPESESHFIRKEVLKLKSY